MGSVPTVVCVREVKQEDVQEWDDSMPLPGDIIEGVAQDNADEDDTFVSAKARSELILLLGKINRVSEHVLLKVRRGDSAVKLRACIVADRNVKMQKKFTVRAASDERHVAVLGDMTFEACFELQEMSRRIVNLDFKGFRTKGIPYDWKLKVGSFLPDHRSTVVGSILFMPRAKERITELLISRAMAWFSAAISSGIPLVFVNIQTEQIISSISFQLFPEPGESRFGMDIKRTEEGFICVYSVTEDSAADRAGLGDLLDQANRTHHLLVISRLQGKSLKPSIVDSEGLIHCCDNADIKETVSSAIEKSESIQIHIMSWPNQTVPAAPSSSAAATLQPPNGK
ncbi:hypothetical protein CDL12_03303 [Handroanthus impetiginosus]|uniref:Uncharacterized protein n=1 Tax=Handroanthus impetiginosus TaxID=429701 RepID=A0A2G9I319_9LAMI|nr:hypothetical protein CDL12_03303 [Handroanthus impetiginosus]